MKKIVFYLIPFFFCLLPLFVFGQSKKGLSSSRFVYQTSASVSYGVGELFWGDSLSKTLDSCNNPNVSIEIQQILAYQFNNYVYAGVGAGLDFWIGNEKTLSVFVPIFANVTVKFMDKKTAPFLFANLGYAFKWQVEQKSDKEVFYGTKAGLFFQAGLGLNVKFSDKISLLLAPQYRLQQSAIEYRIDDFLVAETKNRLFHSVGLKVGVLF